MTYLRRLTDKPSKCEEIRIRLHYKKSPNFVIIEFRSDLLLYYRYKLHILQIKNSIIKH